MAADVTRIRFLSTYETATSFYRDVLPDLAASGADVEVVFSGAEYRQGRTPLKDALRDSGVRVTYVPTGLARADSRVRKVWAMVSFVGGVSLRTLLGRRADTNVFFSTPPFFAVWGAVLRLMRRQNYVCVIMDMYPHVLVEFGSLDQDSPVAHALGRLMRFAWRRAHRVVVIGRCMRNMMVAEGVAPERIDIVQNWAHTAMGEAVSHEDNPLRREWGLESKFVVLYSGNMGVSHSFDEIIAVMKALCGREDIAFVFVGDGSRRRELEEAKQRLSLENLQLRPFQPAERLTESLSVADVHFISLRAGFDGLVVPSKAYGCMATKRPLLYLGRAEGEIARAISDHEMGRVVEPGDSYGLQRAIVEYADDPQRVRREGENALTAHQDAFSSDQALQRYRALLMPTRPDPQS